MSVHTDRCDRLRPLMDAQGLDLLLVTNLVNVRYLCGFTGTNGVCVLGREERIFVTDFRYVERAKSEVGDFEIARGKQNLLDTVAELVERQAKADTRVGFDDNHMTVKAHAALASKLPESAALVGAGGLVERLRAVKDEGELRSIRRAAEIADDLYRWLIEEHGLVGHTELEVARALERSAQDRGAEAAAFPPIVAAGANGALPHADAGDDRIERGSLVVVDLGCRLDGYCSDCTRTLATGEVDAEAREVYELVRSAQEAARAAVGDGAQASGVDAAARNEIERAGRGDLFGHGTGHGVGLEVHEAPRLASNVEGRLEAGNVVTVEPGVYLPGRFGVRIEDLVVVGSNGSEVLTSIPRELTVI